MIHLFTSISFLLNLINLSNLTSAYTPISDASLSAIPAPGADFDIHNGEILAPILKVRVPGTPGIAEVRQHFIDYFSTHLPDWSITYQNSTQPTALGGSPIDFVNIIATRDPPWTKDRPGEVGRLVLAAHYDSKLTPKGFIGATDSAAPCAMILHTAKVLDAALTRKWADMEAKGETDGLEGEKGLQIMLLDGEEAFVSWSDSDSLYGARALAEAWENELHPAMSTYRTPLDGIELFMLLDLLGVANPRMPSYFKTTHWAYMHLAELEKRMRKQGLLKSPNNGQETPWFHDANKNIYTGSFMGGMVQDDHLPFMARGVEILHLIPSPFPSVWHTERDDGEHLDADATSDWAVITSAFVAEWMELEGYLEGSKPALDRRKDSLVDEL